MKTFCKFAVLSALLATSASFALADTISLGSFATGSTAALLGFSPTQTAMNFAGYTATPTAPLNPTTPALLNGTASTYALAPNGIWANPVGNSTWVGSIPSSGPGGAVSPGYGYYQFDTLFTAAGGSYSGILNVTGDDTVEVLLNGSVLVPFGILGSDAQCADSGSSCTSVDAIPLNNLNLLSGLDANTFTFLVDQAGFSTSNNPSASPLPDRWSAPSRPNPAPCCCSAPAWSPPEPCSVAAGPSSNPPSLCRTSGSAATRTAYPSFASNPALLSS
jgi:hypothetical protein